MCALFGVPYKVCVSAEQWDGLENALDYSDHINRLQGIEPIHPVVNGQCIARFGSTTIAPNGRL